MPCVSLHGKGFSEVFKCETHPKGHRTEEARDECLAKAERRAKRKAAKEADEARRQLNHESEPEEEYIRRRYCMGGDQPVNIAASLNRDYPRRKSPWTWADVIKVHVKHLNWPAEGVFSEYLRQNPDVLLPSELRKLAGGLGVEDAQA